MNHLICSSCSATYSLDDRRWRCDCGAYLDIQLKAQFPTEKIAARRPSLWRYREALALSDDDSLVSLGEGFTPMLEMDVSGTSVFIKQEHLSPTGSFKDRGASVLVSKLREMGIREVVEDSSGNAGSAIAAYCQKAGIGCTVFVPERARPEKIAHVESYGAAVVRVDGDRAAAAAAGLKAAESSYYAGHAWNPFFLQGTKTFAYEVWEQLGWRAPDSLILPVGNGTLLLGSYIGFRDLIGAGLIDHMPRLIGVQSANCDPVRTAFRNGDTEVSSIACGETVADGIAVPLPVRGRQILRAVRESAGDLLAVDEAEIAYSLEEMRERGHSIEPTAAAAIAGLRKYLEDAEHHSEIPGTDEVIVSVLTGASRTPAG
jgi:threonine synthase